jgi:hypothetical protein
MVFCATAGEKRMDEIRLARMVKELERRFVPDYVSHNMPAGDKHAAYALEPIAFRMGRIDQKLDQPIATLAAAIAADR